MKIEILRDIPGIYPPGEVAFPNERFGEQFAKTLIQKGLARLVGGEPMPEKSGKPKKKGR